MIAGEPDAVGESGGRRHGSGSPQGRLRSRWEAPFTLPSWPRHATGCARCWPPSPSTTPRFPIVANVDARRHTAAADWELLLSAQLVSPIRWQQSILRLGGLLERRRDAERLFVELGPGDVAVDHGAPHPAERHDGGRVRAGRPRPPGRRRVGQHRPARLRPRPSGRTPVRVRAGGDQPRAGVFEPGRGPRPAAPAPPSRSAPCSAPCRGAEVRSPFAGRLEGALAHPGERVQTGQPIVWLHAS